MPILITALICTGEGKRLYIYFTCEDNGSEGTIYGLALFLFISCLFCATLTSSFFISNEKNSSLFTKLLTNTKTIFSSFTLYVFDKAKNKFNIPIFIGLMMSTLGAIFINVESLFYNLFFKKEKKKNNNKPTQIKTLEESELMINAMKMEKKTDEKN